MIHGAIPWRRKTVEVGTGVVVRIRPGIRVGTHMTIQIQMWGVPIPAMWSIFIFADPWAKADILSPRVQIIGVGTIPMILMI